MLEQIGPLWDIFKEKQQLGEPLVLGTLVKTSGSSYKKPGAIMLIESDKSTHGLISGGCLEADVAEHAMAIFENHQAITLDYDMSDESIFGMGAGCDGTLQLVLQLISGDYLPFSALNPSPDLAKSVSLTILAKVRDDYPIGSYFYQKNNQLIESKDGIYQAINQTSTSLSYTPPPKVAVCGAGIDVIPLLELLHLQQWHVSLIDHHPDRLAAGLHPVKTHVIATTPMEIKQKLGNYEFDAVIIMTHNMERDAAYLQHFATTKTAYLGLLGPFLRRDKILQLAGMELNKIEQRLHAPVGLNLGGHMPENIAVSIVAQLQQFFYQS